MADAVTVSTILNTTGLELGNHLCDIHGYRTKLGVRHKTTGSKDATKLTDLTHHLRSCDGCVKIKVALLNGLDKLVATHDISAGSLRFTGLLALGKDGNSYALTGAVRK